jgi:hypothetical protein
LWLLKNRPAEAREHASEAISRWSGHGFHVQHWYDLMAQTQIDLYEGEGGQAHARFERAWHDLKRSHLLRVNHTRIVATHLRARTAVAAASKLSGASRARCLSVALSSENALRGESAPWGRALGQLICAERESLERPEQAENALELARDQLKATNLGLYQVALESVSSRSLPRPLADRGVFNPSAFARMLLPGLCSNLRLDGGSEHTE